MTYMSKIPCDYVVSQLKKYEWIRKKKHNTGSIKKMSIYLENKRHIEVSEVIKKSDDIYNQIIGEGRENKMYDNSGYRKVIGEGRENIVIKGSELNEKSKIDD